MAKVRDYAVSIVAKVKPLAPVNDLVTTFVTPLATLDETVTTFAGDSHLHKLEALRNRDEDEALALILILAEID